MLGLKQIKQAPRNICLEFVGGSKKGLRSYWRLASFNPFNSHMVVQYITNEKETERFGCLNVRIEQSMSQRQTFLAQHYLLSSATFCNEKFSFMDGFSSYNLISLHQYVSKETASQFPLEKWHYIFMLFDLKNAGATYCRLMFASFMTWCKIA